MEGLERFGAAKRQALDAHKKPWMWPWDACWLRRPGGLGRSNGSGRGVAVACVGGKPLDACWLKVARVLTFWGLRGFGGFGAFRGWQTASLDAHKKPWMWPWDACWLRRPGGLGRSNGSGRGVAVACVGGKPLDACWLKVARVLTFWGLRGFGGFGGFGAFRGWQTASLDAHKKPWMWPWDACWLRRPGGLGRSNGSGRGVAVACVGGKPLDACWLKVARVLTFCGLRGFGGFGAFRGWQTASLDAHKKPWMWPWDACWLRRPGGRGRSNGSGRGVAVACVGGKPLDACWLKVARVLTFWGLRGFGGFGGFGAFRGWQTASLHAHKKPWMWPWDACWLRRPGGLGRSNGSGRGVAVACVGGKPLDACWLKVARVLTFWGLRGFGGFGGFGAFRGWQTASLDAHKKPWMWPWDACWLRRPGGRGRSNGSGRGVAVACVGGKPLDACWLKVARVLTFWGLRGLRGLGGFGGAKKDKFHTCGGPRRRPCLGQGRGRRRKASFTGVHFAREM